MHHPVVSYDVSPVHHTFVFMIIRYLTCSPYIHFHDTSIAAPNCHFRLLNVEEHKATYDTADVDRYTSPGAGAFTPWFNRSSTAARDIEAGSELYVDYGPSECYFIVLCFQIGPIQPI